MAASEGDFELHSEQDVLSKVIVPDLAQLGYRERRQKNGVTLRFNHPIEAHQGRTRTTIYADLVVFIGDAPVIVVDAKNPREFLTDNDREQVISYARLLPDIAPYAALCNGSWQVFDAVRKQQLPDLPNYDNLVRDLQRRRLTENQKKSLVSQATRTLFAIDSARELSRLMRLCHDTIRNLRGYDPTKAFDELSKVLFAKMYEEREVADGRRDSDRFTLATVQEMRRQGVEIIQTLWHDTLASERYRELFADEPAETDIALPPEAIDKIVTILEDKSLALTDLDVKGVAFEEFLSATYRGGGLGQYFTPRQIVNFMVDLVDPAIGDRVIDPSCGTGGFLIRVYDVVSDKIHGSDLSPAQKRERLAELANECLIGIDWETRAARTCKMNMILHGDGHAGVYQGNALDLDEMQEKIEARRHFYPNAPAIEEGTFDIVLTNPPFGARDDVDRIVSKYDLGRGGSQKREVLLLERQVRLLRPGGRLAVVIPEGILSNKNDRHIREFIFHECIVKAVIRLPQDAFKMSEGAACTSILYAIKKNPDDSDPSEQGDIFFARAEYIGITPAGREIPDNDLLAIREQFQRFESGTWDGIEMEALEDDRVRFIREEPGREDGLWLEPLVNRTSLLYDRLSYVLRCPKIDDRFSYTYNHPRYYRTMQTLDLLGSTVLDLESLCVKPYPARGKKPSEESAEGLSVLKVRNITGRGIDLDTEYAPDTEEIRSECARALLERDDILITSTGEGTIGRVETYPYEEAAIVDGHITICRLAHDADESSENGDVDTDYVAEFLRSEHGQVQMLRHVSGSTGQTELLIDHIRALRLPLPAAKVQRDIVATMRRARTAGEELDQRAVALRDESANVLAEARREMLDQLMND
jgi:type I restriction enzyme M protein